MTAVQKRFVAKNGVDNNNQTLTNVADPVNAQDVATKNFAVNATNLTTGTLPAARLPAFTGDATTVAGNSALTLTTTGVGAGSYGTAAAVPVLTVDAKGRITGATVAAITPAGIGAIPSSQLGAANGVAQLDASGKLTTAQIPAALVGAMQYQGVWNASTNTPALASGAGTKGQYFKVSVAGSTVIDGVSQWNVGDMIAFDGTTWDKIDGLASEVTSVAGRVGAVVLTATDISGLATSATTDTTNASNITSGTLGAARLPAFTGDATSGVGTNVLTLANSGVGAGSYGAAATIPVITVDAKGRVTGVTTQAVAAAWGNVTGKPTTLAGYGITDAVSNNGVFTMAQGDMTTQTLTTSTTTAGQVLDAWPVTQYRTAKYIIQGTSGSAYHSMEVFILQDGTSVYLNEYADISSGSSLFTVDASIVSGNVQLQVTPVNAATVFKSVRQTVTV